MINNFLAVFNLNRLFLKLNRFVCNYLPVLPVHRSWNLNPKMPKHNYFCCLKSMMRPKTVSKVVCEIWKTLYQVDLALRPTEYGASRSVKSMACRLCEVYGQEQDTDETVVEEVVLPLLTQEETCERKRRKKTTKMHLGTKFHVDTIHKHHCEQHAKSGPHIRSCCRRSIASLRSSLYSLMRFSSILWAPKCSCWSQISTTISQNLILALFESASMCTSHSSYIKVHMMSYISLV